MIFYDASQAISFLPPGSPFFTPRNVIISFLPPGSPFFTPRNVITECVHACASASVCKCKRVHVCNCMRVQVHSCASAGRVQACTRVHISYVQECRQSVCKCKCNYIFLTFYDTDLCPTLNDTRTDFMTHVRMTRDVTCA